MDSSALFPLRFVISSSILHFFFFLFLLSAINHHSFCSSSCVGLRMSWRTKCKRATPFYSSRPCTAGSRAGMRWHCPTDYFLLYAPQVIIFIGYPYASCAFTLPLPSSAPKASRVKVHLNLSQLLLGRRHHDGMLPASVHLCPKEKERRKRTKKKMNMQGQRESRIRTATTSRSSSCLPVTRMGSYWSCEKEEEEERKRRKKGREEGKKQKERKGKDRGHGMQSD